MRTGRDASQVVLSGPQGQEIQSLEDWRRYGGPQKDWQWQDGRSAKECAKAWLRQGRIEVPQELDALFRSHPILNKLVLHDGQPEVETKIDHFRGNGRFHDLLLQGSAASDSVVVSIEAKADESFGDLVHVARREALKGSRKTNVPARIQLLKEALFAADVDVEEFRYQLLYGIAATLIEASRAKAEIGVFVIHEFLMDGHYSQRKVDQNGEDLLEVLRGLGCEGPMKPGGLIQVPPVPGGRFIPSGIDLYVGKVRTT